MKNETKEKSPQSKTISEVLLAIFVIISLCLALTLYFYFRVNSRNADELGLNRDVHFLRAQVYDFTQKDKNIGFVEIKEVFDGVHILGKITGLVPGSFHGLHILEYADLITMKDVKMDKALLRHYNPSNLPHSCPDMNNFNDIYHVGDLGNVIANNKGEAFFSIMKRNSINGISGRMVVLTKTKDKCESEKEYDEIADILGAGLLSVFRTQAITNNADGKSDYLIREINSIDKEKFERTIPKEVKPSAQLKPSTPAKRLLSSTVPAPSAKTETKSTPETTKPKEFDFKDLFKNLESPKIVHHETPQFKRPEPYRTTTLHAYQPRNTVQHKPTFINSSHASKKSDDDDIIFPKRMTTPPHLMSDDEVYPGLKQKKPEQPKVLFPHKVANKKSDDDDDDDDDAKLKKLTDSLFKSEKTLEEQEKKAHPHPHPQPAHHTYFFPHHPASRPHSPYANSFGPFNNNHASHETFRPHPQYQRPTIIRPLRNTPPILTQLIPGSIEKSPIPLVNSQKPINETKIEVKLEEPSPSFTIEKEKEIIDKKLKESIDGISKMKSYEFIPNPKQIDDSPSRELLEKKVVKLKDLNTVLQEESSNKFKNPQASLVPNNLTHGDFKKALLNTSHPYVKEIDPELINPFSGMLNNNKEEVQNISLNYNEIKNVSSPKMQPNNTNQANEEGGIDIMHKVDDIKNIIKNKTITTLNKIRHFDEPSPIIPQEKNPSPEYKIPKIDFTSGSLQSFNPFKLLKFKESDYANALKGFNTIKSKEEKEEKESVEETKEKKSSIKRHKRHRRGKYESTKKMFENIDNQSKYEEKLNHNAKLFLNHFKKNIDKIEDIANNNRH